MKIHPPWLLACSIVTVLVIGTQVVFAQQGEYAGPPTRWLDETPREINRRPTIPEYLQEMAWKELDQEVLLIAGSATAWRWNDQKWFSDFRKVSEKWFPDFRSNFLISEVLF